MNLFCVGLSHHNADVGVREYFAGHVESDRALRNCGCNEALVLSTCNRVEVYAASEKRVSTDEIARCLVRDDTAHRFAPPFYRYEGEKCAQHLFRVTSGLDSMVVGETEILGQAKKAYEAARATSAAGRYLHRLFQRAFRVAKQVRTHTEITRGAVSVGSLAVNGRAIGFEQWLEQCREVDILITSTSSEVPLLWQEKLAPMLRERIDRPLFIIDIAVPRDVAPDVNALDGVYLYDIDSLQSIAEQSLATRRAQVAAAEQIISQHVAEFDEMITRGLNCPVQSSEHPTVGIVEQGG